MKQEESDDEKEKTRLNKKRRKSFPKFFSPKRGKKTAEKIEKYV